MERDLVWDALGLIEEEMNDSMVFLMISFDLGSDNLEPSLFSTASRVDFTETFELLGNSLKYSLTASSICVGEIE